MSRWWTVKRAEAVWWKIPFSRGSIGAGVGWTLEGRVQAQKVGKKLSKKCSRKKIPFRGSIGAGGGWELGGRVRAPNPLKKCSRKKDPLQQRLNWS